MKAQSKKVTMVKERETKRTWRFQAKDIEADPIVETVYIQKRHLQSLGNPDSIEVSVSPVEEGN